MSNTTQAKLRIFPFRMKHVDNCKKWEPILAHEPPADTFQPCKCLEKLLNVEDTVEHCVWIVVPVSVWSQHLVCNTSSQDERAIVRQSWMLRLLAKSTKLAGINGPW